MCPKETDKQNSSFQLLAGTPELIANLKAEGKTVLVISHNLEHVFTVADRLIVLRRGRRVGTRLKSETTREEIVGLITAAIKGDVAA